MIAPLHFRKKIPFYHHKTANEFRQDPYEQFDPIVIKQTALHLAEVLWDTPPYQGITDWMLKHCQPNKAMVTAEIGCGVGKWIGEIALKYPEATCWGLDYSYQLLKQAEAYWLSGETIELDWSNRGFEKLLITGHRLKNLNLGLAKAEALPFDDQSIDLLSSSFLLDRLRHPELAIGEMHRVLRPGGQLLLVSPLNFQKKELWDLWYPEHQLLEKMASLGFEISNWEKDLTITEPLDRRGNCISWHCLAIAAIRK